MKTWYVASIIMWVKFKDGNQNKCPVWENVVIVRAATLDKAIKKFEKIGHEHEGDQDHLFKWGGRSFEWKFGGIRKIKDISALNNGNIRISHGSLITSSQFEVKTQKAFQELIDNYDVKVKYLEE